MNGHSTHENRHVVSFKTYFATGAALLLLTAVTVGVSFIKLGGWNAIAAVGIASVKAILVAFIFMHLLYDKKIFLVIFSVAIIFLAIFLALTMFDILSRGEIYPDYEKTIEKNAVIYNKAEPAPMGGKGASNEFKETLSENANSYYNRHARSGDSGGPGSKPGEPLAFEDPRTGRTHRIRTDRLP